MPEHIGDEYSMAAGQIRKLFSPLIINGDGLCEVCEKPNKKGKKTAERFRSAVFFLIVLN